MTHTPSQFIVRTSRRHLQRGQSIVVALLVLLLLAFLGGLFASIVTRNLRSASRAGRVQNADFYAQAGLRFADDQLTHSPDGADWRPPMQFQLASAYLPATGSRARARYDSYVAANAGFVAPNVQDPDKAFLEQGFARYTIGQGRFLLRLTYTPVPGAGSADPRGRYIKIESVGRDGVVDATDPTTYNNATVTRLNAALTEYKAIGITDYARFETNPDKRSDVMALGVASQYHTNNGNTDYTPNGIVTPGVYDFNANTNLQAYPVITTYGASDAYTTQLTPNPTGGAGGQPGGGSIHVNGSVRFFGVNDFYLNNTGANSGSLGETLEASGNILLDGYVSPATGVTTSNLDTAQSAAVVLEPATGTPTAANYVTPSNDNGGANGGFSTHNGLVRDGGTQTDAQGQPRSVNRLEPPTLDSTDPVSNLTRYKAITQNAPARATDSATGTTITDANAGLDGYGRSIYIDNNSDKQPESSKLLGGFTLVDEWLHRAEPGSSVGGGRDPWVANFYRPPGVEVVLGRQRVTVPGTGGNGPASKTFYGVRLVRSDVDGAGQPVYWKNPDGTAGTGGTMTISYDDLDASNDLTANPATLTGAALTSYQANPNNDVIIYVEGNVRVRGAVSANTAATGPDSDTTNPTDATAVDDGRPRHITIVTNGTAYIDGPLVRGNPDSSISVLAHDYVCVNTTQFLAGAQVDDDFSGTQPPGAFTGDPSLRALDFSLSDSVLVQEFNGVIGNSPALYVSGGPSGSGTTQADFDILDPRTGYSLTGASNVPFAVSPVGAPLYSSTGVGTNTFSHTTYPLALTFGTADSQFYQLAVRRAPVQYITDASGNKTPDPNAIATQDFLLERTAVLPMDVRIEATLFAQTRSFFVIPGEWFNTASDDNMANFVGNSGRPLSEQRSGTDASIPDAARFPFYGQPVDLKINIYGSVSEARPADIAAQTAWMLKWGWIPQVHGSTFANAAPGEPAGHTAKDASNNPIPAVGLSIVYNPLAAYPYNANNYLRTDIFGRPLAYTPKLPVCAGLLYAGQSFDQPILQ